MDVKKLDAYTIEVTRTSTSTATHDLGFLKEQRASVLAQRDRDNQARDAELAELDELLAQADKLGVTARPDEAAK